MKILVANPGADLYGSDRMALQTVAGLVDAGAEVIVTVPWDGPLVAELQRLGARTVITPTPVIRKAALRPRGMITLLAELITGFGPGIALLGRDRPDVLVVNTITPPLWLVLGRLLRIPVVCHVHEGEASVARWLRIALAAPLLLADRLIINSRFSLEVLAQEIPRLCRKAEVVYNAVPGPPQTQPPRTAPHGPTRLLFVGRLSVRKGPQVAIDAVKILTEKGRDVRLDLVGAPVPGSEWFLDQLRSQAAAAGIGDRVDFRGFHADIWPDVTVADICLVPSTTDEPFGNTAVEAALGARPLIVSGTSGLLEATAGLTACLRIPPDAPEAIADAVQLIMDDWSGYARKAVADAAMVKDRYSQTAYRERINKIIFTAAGRDIVGSSV